MRKGYHPQTSLGVAQEPIDCLPTVELVIPNGCEGSSLNLSFNSGTGEDSSRSFGMTSIL